MEFKDVRLYTRATKARHWLETHWQKSGTDEDICGRSYEPKLFEKILEKYEEIINELSERKLPEYPESSTTASDSNNPQFEKTIFTCPVVETRQSNSGIVEIRDHPTSALKIIDEQVICTKCGVSWPRELTKHFSILK
ncbi:hypothetical protein M1345_01540 [Patescibacteria group bacterium]|nr:hypothetical protein [Patescibacteria group bacterium]